MPNHQGRAAGTHVILAPRAGFSGTLGRVLGGFWDRLLRWQARASARHHLAHLSDRYLKDVGLSRADLAPEIAKPFWQP